MSGYEPPRDWADVLKRADPRPPAESPREPKQRYGQSLSRNIAEFLAVKMRALGGGFTAVRPGPEGGAEAIVLAGTETKRLDVSLVSRSGLVLAVSVKTINHAPWSKNLKNRVGDLSAEATQVHKRYPYAVLGGLFAFEKGAHAYTPKKKAVSTFQRACEVFSRMAGRRATEGDYDRFEHFAALLYDAETYEVALYPQPVAARRAAGSSFHEILRSEVPAVAEAPPLPAPPGRPISVEDWVREIAETVRERNAGF